MNPAESQSLYKVTVNIISEKMIGPVTFSLLSIRLIVRAKRRGVRVTASTDSEEDGAITICDVFREQGGKKSV